MMGNRRASGDLLLGGGADCFLTGATGDAGVVGSGLGLELAGRYRVEEELGRGGMGVVYRCWDRWREGFVALKLVHEWLPEGLQEALRAELKLQEGLRHDGVVQTYELGRLEEEGRWYFTMEYVQGPSLAEVLEEAKEQGCVPPVSFAWVRGWLAQLVEVLEYAHGKGVVHRDLKPSNILLPQDGALKVLDFGIAKQLGADEDSFHTGRVGTAYYMAPEQLEEGAVVLPAADIYAVGVMLYQLLTGKIASGRLRGPWEVLRQQGMEPAFAQTLDEVVLRALEPEPEARYQDATALWQAFCTAAGEAKARPWSGGLEIGGVQLAVEHAPPATEETGHSLQQQPDMPDLPNLPDLSDLPAPDGAFTLQTGKGSYRLLEELGYGDISTVYRGVSLSEGKVLDNVVAKIVDEAEDNDLMRDELRVLKLFLAQAGAQHKHLPTLLDQFETADGRLGLILRELDAFDLEAIRRRYTEGLPPEHAIWILRRALSVVGFAHSKGIIHGNIEPAHLLVRPYDHNVFLIDWSYAVLNPAQTRQGFKCFNPDYSPPEVEQRKLPIPASDIYSLGKCMIVLLGGDLDTNTMPERVDERLQRFLQYMVRDSARQRPQDAWELYHQLCKLRKTIYGKHRFVTFPM